MEGFRPESVGRILTGMSGRDFARNQLEGFYLESVEGSCPESVGGIVPGISWDILIPISGGI